MKDKNNNTVIRKNNIKSDGNTHICVYDFMMSGFGLKMPEYMVYALVYAYSSNKGTLFTSKERIAERLNCSLSTVYRAIESLVDSGFIEKVDSFAGLGHNSSYRVLRREPTYYKKEKILPFGQTGKVRLTCEQYSKLICDSGYEKVSEAIDELDLIIRKNPKAVREYEDHSALITKLISSSSQN